MIQEATCLSLQHCNEIYGMNIGFVLSPLLFAKGTLGTLIGQSLKAGLNDRVGMKINQRLCDFGCEAASYRFKQTR